MIICCSKKLSALLIGITLKDNADFYCFNCLHSFRTKHKLQSRIKVCESKDFSILSRFNQNKESDEASVIVYADLQCLIENIDGCKNNSSMTKVAEHISSGFSMSTI